MNKEEYQNLIDDWISEEYSKLTPETLAQFEPETIEAIVTTNLMERQQQRCLTYEEFKRCYVESWARCQVEEYLEERRPKGSYDPKALIPISADTWKQMPKATREDLLNWYELEGNPDNLDYIVERVNVWGP